MADIQHEQDALFDRIAEIIDAARRHVARTVNTAMVHAYWLIGREIVEVEQHGSRRAEYGEGLVRALAERLGDRYGKGFSYASVKRMKRLYLLYPRGSSVPEDMGGYAKGSLPMSRSVNDTKGSTPLSLSELVGGTLFPPMLSWSHYLALMRVESDEAMYVNHFDRNQRTESEAPTVGIVLCSDKNDAMVKITLPEDNTQIHASRYQLYLPTEDELKAELERERAEAERILRENAEREQ